MAKLSKEVINGKQYQPVEVDDTCGVCEKCALNNNCDGAYLHKCDEIYRVDKLNVYFTELGDTNEQE